MRAKKKFSSARNELLNAAGGSIYIMDRALEDVRKKSQSNRLRISDVKKRIEELLAEKAETKKDNPPLSKSKNMKIYWTANYPY